MTKLIRCELLLQAVDAAAGEVLAGQAVQAVLQLQLQLQLQPQALAARRPKPRQLLPSRAAPCAARAACCAARPRTAPTPQLLMTPRQAVLLGLLPMRHLRRRTGTEASGQQVAGWTGMTAELEALTAALRMLLLEVELELVHLSASGTETSATVMPAAAFNEAMATAMSTATVRIMIMMTAAPPPALQVLGAAPALAQSCCTRPSAASQAARHMRRCRLGFATGSPRRRRHRRH